MDGKPTGLGAADTSSSGDVARRARHSASLTEAEGVKASLERWHPQGVVYIEADEEGAPRVIWQRAEEGQRRGKSVGPKDGKAS